MSKRRGRGGHGHPWAVGFLLLCSGAALAVGCSGRGFSDVDSLIPKSQTASSVAPVERTVGAGGGTVTSTEGSGVEIPADAVPNDVDVSVAPASDVTAPPATEQVGDAYTLGPSGIQFAVPVTVVLAFDPAKLPEGKTAADIVVLTAPDGTTTFQKLPTQQRDATHVTAETTHFSHFVPAILTPEFVDHPRPSCVAVTCASGSFSCGRHDDGCGGQIDCGTCDAGIVDGGVEPGGGTKDPKSDAGTDPKSDAGTEPKVDAGTPPKGDPGTEPKVDAGTEPKVDAGTPPKVDAGTPPKVDAGVCTPVLCGHYGPGACGILKDECGGQLDCGACPPAAVDAGKDPGGDAGACMPLSCANYPKTCGWTKDGCGSEIHCEGGCLVPPSDAGPPPVGTDAATDAHVEIPRAPDPLLPNGRSENGIVCDLNYEQSVGPAAGCLTNYLCHDKMCFHVCNDLFPNSCGDGLTCIGRTCSHDCTGNVDCGPGYYCAPHGLYENGNPRSVCLIVNWK